MPGACPGVAFWEGALKRWLGCAQGMAVRENLKTRDLVPCISCPQVAIADMVFDVLKIAWGKFEASNK